MMYVNKKLCLLIWLCLVSLASIGQTKKVNKAINLSFKINDNYKTSTPPGFVGDSIDYFEKIDIGNSEITFRIFTEEFKTELSDKGVETLTSIDVLKVNFHSLEQMFKDWEVSDKVLRSDVYEQIYLYEFLSENKIRRYKVYWAGGYEN